MVTLASDVERELDRSAATLRPRFVATVFASSFLLFLVQPMIARMALPRLGGAPSVWNSAMLVYQALLLFGYAYAHGLGYLRSRVQAGVHLAVLALAGLTLPIGLLAAPLPPNANPFLWVPWLLLLSVGPLFFAISAQAPLLQRWFALTGGDDPYPLYAASNLGSFGGLIAYPLLVEPLMPLWEQRWLWSAAYVLVILLVGWCAASLPRAASAKSPPSETVPAPDRRTVARWIALSAVPSGLILSTTLYITTDILAMPLLWVLPLAAYLLSFTVAFASNRTATGAISRCAPLLLLFAGLALFMGQSAMSLLFCGLAIVNLFTLSVAIHSQLYDSRPSAQHLTLFYLAMSIGGVLGGAFCALAAPMIFDWTYEYLLLLVAAAWLMRTPNPFSKLATFWNRGIAAHRATVAGIAVLVVLAVAAKGLFGLPPSDAANRACIIAILAIAIIAIGNRALFTFAAAALLVSAGGWERLQYSATPGAMTRSFFGIYSLRDGPQHSRMLVHGTTIHGMQNLGSPARQRMATSYYARSSGVGLAMQAAPRLFGPNARIAVVGLGAGTLACYAQPGQSWTFYEIDPVIVGIARDPSRFTFVSGCKPDARIEVGDARLLIERERSASADLLVVDAFSSDSVPMHLLTREAFAAYRRLLSPKGLLLVHISNRYIDLKPVIAGAAAAEGWSARLRLYRPGPDRMKLNEGPSDWVVLSPSPATLGTVVGNGAGWLPLEPVAGFVPWTDDHASVLPLVYWRGKKS